ncbi:MAG: hypothetical protein IIW56_03235 [Oscillospiraceae bacterium]|jgi:hypothetical protein|nr:hypothetical protein [Oscillospiraceae bacterium]
MEEKNLETTEEKAVPIEEQSAKSLWQQTKESWYDKVPLTVKQLDIIIACGIGGLVLTFIAIALDAMGIF